MPELPEVETVRRTLEQVLVSKKITHISVFYAKMIQHQSMEDFTTLLQNQTFKSLDRRGKYLIFNFDSLSLLVHLRMEGKFFIRSMNDPIQKHEHVAFDLDNGMSLRYHDTRKFGTMELLPTEKISDRLSFLGPEPMSDSLTFAYLYPKIKKSQKTIKSLLLDQTIISGLGNIYVDEVCFLSRIHPSKKGNRLTKKQIESIITSAQKVIGKAIELGGSTIRSYTSSLGVTGRFQNELFVHTREGEPCKECGATILKTKVSGRGTYYCPVCQRK